MSMGSPKKAKLLMYFLSAVLKKSSSDFARMLAIAPLGTAASNRERYWAGVSPSSRSGYEIASRVSENDPGLEAEPGVAGPPRLGDPLREKDASEFCRSRCGRLNKSPKLFRPLADVEFRPERRKGGVRRWSSRMSATDPRVEDLPRRPKRPWPLVTDEADFPERAEVVESFLNSGGAAALEGDSPVEEWVGDGRGESWSWSEFVAPVRLGVASAGLGFESAPFSFAGCELGDSGGGILTGSGKSGPRLFMRRGKRNSLLLLGLVSSFREGVREIPCSQELLSDREDSESLVSSIWELLPSPV